MLILGAQLAHFLDGQTRNLRNHLIFQLSASDQVASGITFIFQSALLSFLTSFLKSFLTTFLPLFLGPGL